MSYRRHYRVEFLLEIRHGALAIDTHLRNPEFDFEDPFDNGEEVRLAMISEQLVEHLRPFFSLLSTVLLRLIE